ncbi:MAG: MarR family winged helix-turn-helix transcriptional regulator [Microvirga sp.]|nr:MarR family winged helix-turn-helix transcriptional regulator [Microvirga sp.]
MTASTAARTRAPALALESFLPYRLVALSARTSNALARIYAERFELTIPQWRVIATLGQFPVATARDIAGHGMMHKSTVSRAVSSLLGRGLLRKEPNANDMREEDLRLTDSGRRIYDAIVPEALAFEARLLTALEPQERRLFLAMVEKLDAQARSLAPDGEIEA